MCTSSLSVVLGVFLQQDDQNYFLSLLGYPRGVSQYTQGTWEIESILVLSNAQPFERGILIYHQVHEVPFNLPQSYTKCDSIY